MNRHRTYCARGGFTLIEVSLAILVVGIGLLALFGLFPSGMRSGEEALQDTRAGFFGSVVLEGMRANAAGIKVWSEWSDDATMLGAASPLCASLDGVGTLVSDGSTNKITDFPTGSSKPIRYSLVLSRPTTRTCGAYMKVWERTGSTYSEFYTEFLFGGR